VSEVTVLDPTAGPASARGEVTPLLLSLSGKAGVLLDIPKPQGVRFLERVQELARQKHGIKEISPLAWPNPHASHAVDDRYSLTTEAIRWP